MNARGFIPTACGKSDMNVQVVVRVELLQADAIKLKCYADLLLEDDQVRWFSCSLYLDNFLAFN